VTALDIGINHIIMDEGRYGGKRRNTGDEEKGSCLETLQKVLDRTEVEMRHSAAMNRRE
jgi:hypothetical protein